jgi:HK97 family phage portal protein
MAWYHRLLFKKAASTEKRSSTFRFPASWLVGGSGVSGMNVTRETALSISAVYRAVWLISGTVASIPFNVYKKKNSAWEKDETHYLNTLLNRKPSEIYNAFNFKQVLLIHLLSDGNAFVQIKDNQLIIEDYRSIDPFVFENKKFYRFSNGEIKLNEEMLHFMGLSFGVNGMNNGIQQNLRGLSPIAATYSVHAGALAETEYTNKFFENGAAPSGVIEVDGELGDIAYERLKSSFQQSYGGVQNVGKTPIMESGAKYKTITISPRDAMIIEKKKLTVADIARIYSVPTHLLYDLDRATYASVENLSQEFISYGIKPRVELLEAELNSKFFPDSDYEIRGDLDALLRGDSAARANLYKELFYTGAMSPNEIRKSEGLIPYSGGDQRFIQVNMMPVVENMKSTNIKEE